MFIIVDRISGKELENTFVDRSRAELVLASIRHYQNTDYVIIEK